MESSVIRSTYTLSDSYDECTAEAGQCPSHRNTAVGAWWDLTKVPRYKQAKRCGGEQGPYRTISFKYSKILGAMMAI